MLELDFSIAQPDCKNLTICDTTAEYDPCVEFPAGAYGSGANPTKYDVDSTDFDIIFPDGTTNANVDIGFVPGRKAYGEFQITAGTSGTIVVDVNGVLLGNVIFTTDIQTTIDLLVNAINGNAAQTGWYAEDMGSSTVRIYSLKFGTAYNGLALNVGLSGTLAVLMTTDPTANAVGDGDCIEGVQLSTLITGIPTPPELLTGATYPDGVYDFTYRIYDSGSTELATKQKKFLFTCNVDACLKEKILALKDSCCDDCEKENLNKILEIQSRVLQAQYQFDQGLYACANDTIISAGKLCDNICNDC